jgi:hypothetical protein
MVLNLVPCSLVACTAVQLPLQYPDHADGQSSTPATPLPLLYNGNGDRALHAADSVQRASFVLLVYDCMRMADVHDGNLCVPWRSAYISLCLSDFTMWKDRTAAHLVDTDSTVACRGCNSRAKQADGGMVYCTHTVFSESGVGRKHMAAADLHDYR